jgi:hypothetical protein
VTWFPRGPHLPGVWPSLNSLALTFFSPCPAEVFVRAPDVRSKMFKFFSNLGFDPSWKGGRSLWINEVCSRGVKVEIPQNGGVHLFSLACSSIDYG